VLCCEVLVLLAHVLELVGGRIEDLNIGCQVLISPILTGHWSIGFKFSSITNLPELGNLVERLISHLGEQKLMVSYNIRDEIPRFFRRVVNVLTNCQEIVFESLKDPH
jgi:hypothetical protein